MNLDTLLMIFLKIGKWHICFSIYCVYTLLLLYNSNIIKNSLLIKLSDLYLFLTFYQMQNHTNS